MEFRSKKIALLGLFTALTFVFSYIEYFLPIPLGIPGVKLGMANLVILVAIYILSIPEAFFLSVIRLLLVAFTFGNLSAFLFSLAGAVLSFLVMIAAKKSKHFSVMGVSVAGGVAHNIGQIIVAVLILETEELILYLPVLILSGLLAGIVVGLLGGLITNRVRKFSA